MLRDLTWTCHLCGQTRPNDRISVRKRPLLFRGVELVQNVRYCNDNPDCIDRSKTHDLVQPQPAPDCN